MCRMQQLWGNIILVVQYLEFMYYTFGTGVGGGAIQRGEFVGGMNFPEMGHMIVKRHP